MCIIYNNFSLIFSNFSDLQNFSDLLTYNMPLISQLLLDIVDGVSERLHRSNKRR